MGRGTDRWVAQTSPGHSPAGVCSFIRRRAYCRAVPRDPSIRMLAGLLVGTALGVLAHVVARRLAPALEAFVRYVTEPVGKIFLRLLFMLVIPLIVSALALGVAGLGDLREPRAHRPEDARLHGRRVAHRGAARRRRW